MSTTAFIRSHQPVNSKTVRVVATLVSEAGTFSKESVRTALQAATKSKFAPVADSVILREDGATRRTVSAFMKLASDVISIPETQTVESATGFRALSSNMFLDDNENLWELNSESGRNLVRTHIENNMEEMTQLMQSVSSVEFSSLSSVGDINLANALDQELLGVQGGDWVSYVSESGDLESTGVIATSDDDPNTLLCLSSDMTAGVELNRNSVVGYMSGADYINQLEQPEGIASMSGGTCNVNTLVDYYSRVFGYNKEYLAKLTERIRAHSYA